MEIKVVTGDIKKIKAGAVIINFFEESKKPGGETAAVDKAMNGEITRLIKQGEIKGKLGEVTVIHSQGKIAATRVAVVGLGKAKDLTADKVRGAVAETCRLLRRKNVETITSVAQGAGTAGITFEGSGQAIAEGALLGLYLFRRHITKEPEHGEIKELSIVDSRTTNVSALKKGVNKGRILAEAANTARDMVNEPGNYMTPTDMAKMATKLAETYRLEVQIFDKKQIEKLKMGALLGVAQGSQQPPKFIVLQYKGSRAKKIDLALVGKGITFDSGGISIKPSEGMGEMKGDMAGGAAVMSTISAIARLKPKINVMAIIAATENLPSGTAFKPGDILTAMNGKTIEIITTDAEGRLTLADALGYAIKNEAKQIIDVATLTGACVVALGNICTGLFGNNQELIEKVKAAAAESGELVWQLPMFDEYKEQNKSNVADIQNSGGRGAGASTAALFLAEFVGDVPWVHLDMAGTDASDKERNYTVKGATGVPVRTLVNLALSLAKQN